MLFKKKKKNLRKNNIKANKDHMFTGKYHSLNEFINVTTTLTEIVFFQVQNS